MQLHLNQVQGDKWGYKRHLVRSRWFREAPTIINRFHM